MILFSGLTSTTLRGWISPTGIIELLERDISAGNEKLQGLPLDFLHDELEEQKEIDLGTDFSWRTIVLRSN